MSAQLTAAYLRCVVISTQHFHPTGATARRQGASSSTFSPEAMTTALQLAAHPSLIEKVLAGLFCLLTVEEGSFWFIGVISAEAELGMPMPLNIWVQVVGVVSFMLTLCGTLRRARLGRHRG